MKSEGDESLPVFWVWKNNGFLVPALRLRSDCNNGAPVIDFKLSSPRKSFMGGCFGLLTPDELQSIMETIVNKRSNLPSPPE